MNEIFHCAQISQLPCVTTRFWQALNNCLINSALKYSIKCLNCYYDPLRIELDQKFDIFTFYTIKITSEKANKYKVIEENTLWKYESYQFVLY